MGVQLPLATADSLLRLTAEQLEVMAARGAFARLPRIELRDGLPHQMIPQYFPHAIAKTRVFAGLLTAVERLDLSLDVLSEASIRVSADEVPMPDISLVRSGRYPAAVPVEQVQLAVEVSDTTLAADLGRKRALYALGGIPEYWVVDLSARVILQHWSPDGDAYVKAAVVPFGRDLASATLPGLVISTARLRKDSDKVAASD